MPSTDPAALKPKQLGALIILMSEARIVDNNELDELAGCRLTGDEWKVLAKRGLIEQSKVGQTYAFQLTDKGWGFCKRLHDTQVDVGNSTAARSIFTLLAGLHRSLDRLRVSHADFFKQSVDSPPAAHDPGTGVDEIEASIRQAYRDLVRRPGQWVGLADLRDRLPDLEASDVDATLIAMAQMEGVRVIPVANSKALDDRDRAAALRMGGENHHALSIGSP
jgi:hypothetical protein